MGFPRKISHLILLASLPALLWVFYNQASNWHLHQLANGMVVEHAHPYRTDAPAGTPFQQHHHGEDDYFYLTLISGTTTLLLVLMTLAMVLMSKPLLRRPATRVVLQRTAHLAGNPHRGPPCLV